MADEKKVDTSGSGMDAGNSASSGKGDAKEVAVEQDAPKVKSSTPENAKGKINPAAPGETGTTEKHRG